MNKRLTQLITLTVIIFASIAHAETFSGKDTALYYKNTPEQFEGEHADVDCAFVSRINRGPQINGITFFLAHTIDEDNRLRGGSIVVAVLSDKADSFVRKYGNAPDIQHGGMTKVDSKRLRGIFHQLDKGHVYIDMTDGQAHQVILQHKETAKKLIKSSDHPSGMEPPRIN
ncbi:hypothetical protein QEH59_02090 [Coraliomargarita sp. SDUM461004]|uniref:Uncharacterized protein n=1 Tax=Thalassobacterium sedimentorum TaxID=3041258 RepID=A0ABU1AEV6_9BACT|nr:hypothetical protein [Coraliomargarita sp. SDUM461004]MDQ8193199.1 hypothetical protein [Coraliomargarita sp. SDUM461004]